MTAMMAGLALICLCALLGAASWIRSHSRLLKRLHIPTCIVAGVLMLALGPQGLGHLVGGGGAFPPAVVKVWHTLPGLLIDVVFGSLLIGRPLPSMAQAWRLSAPHVISGSIISFGQFALSGATELLILGPVFGLPTAAGALLELSFSGGHGTVAGLQPQLQHYGVGFLVEIGLGLATISMVLAVVVGTALAQRVRVRSFDLPAANHGVDLDIGRLSQDQNDPAGPKHASGLSALASALMFISIAILIGLAILEGLRWLETRVSSLRLLEALPLFPLAVIGSAIVQLLARPLRYEKAIDGRMAADVGGAALDLLVASAIGTISLDVLAREVMPMVIFTIVGTVWSVVVFLYIGRHLFEKHGAAHAIADFGQSVGNVATGFILVDMADPEARTDARIGYTYKQLIYGPLFGGGLVTAMAVPLIEQFGLPKFTLATAIGTVLLVLLGLRRVARVARSR